MKNKLFLLLSIVSYASMQTSDVFRAVESKDTKLIQKWLKNNPDLEQLNQHDQTVLIKAVQAKNNKLVYQLIKEGALVNQVDQFGKTALDYAVEMGNKKVVRMLANVRAMVTTESNLVKCKELLTKSMNFSGLRIFAVLAIGCFGWMITFYSFAMVALGAMSLVCLGIVGATVTAGVIYGAVKICKSNSYDDVYDQVSVVQPVVNL